MDEICFVIPGTNEIGAKLTRWIIITDYANLIVMDGSAGAVLCLNTMPMHGFPRATAGEMFVSRNSAHDFWSGIDIATGCVIVRFDATC